MSARHVAVVGAGLSGALQAIHLVRAGIGRVTLIERGRTPGRGVAYGTDRPEHLLNVPARRMSGYPDDPMHFVRWFAAHGGAAEDFAPRRLYGDYVGAELSAVSDRVETVAGEAVDVAGSDGGERARLADGRAILADAVVLAPGNLTPGPPDGLDIEAMGTTWVGDPWSGAAIQALARAESVVLLGTGLTAIDVLLTLDASGFCGRALAVSRRGLVPRSHAAREALPPPADLPPADCVGLLRHVRRRGEEVGWRSAVFELRTITQRLWQNAGEEERRRFLRHLRPWWDAHRHRIAPAVAATVDRMQADGRLVFAAGRIVAATEGEFHWRPRGRERVERLRVDQVVNCTGPELDIVRAGEPLLDALTAAGRAQPGSNRLGLAVDPDCRVLGAGGARSETLFAIGPITRGTFWECNAVPDIRVQAQRVAARLAGAGCA